MILKGGLFLYSLTNFDSRVTFDVDFLLTRLPNTPEKLEKVLNEIISIDTGNNFISFEIKNIKPIAITKKYAGIRALLIARIKNTRTPISIDFGVGDVIVPKQIMRQIPTQLPDFKSPTVLTYSVESTIAEKLDAILSLMELSSRMKDYYDIYYLSQKFNFCGDTLVNAIIKTFENREHIFKESDFSRMLNFDKNEEMQKKWIAFTRKIDLKSVDFKTVLNTIQSFLKEPIQSFMSTILLKKHWDPQTRKWL